MSFKLDSTITLGNVLSMLTMVGGIFALYINLNNSVITLQERMSNYGEAFQELRTTQNNQWRAIAQLQNDVATLKAQRGIK